MESDSSKNISEACYDAWFWDSDKVKVETDLQVAELIQSTNMPRTGT